VGLTRGTTREQIVRAGLESIAFSSRDVVDAMVNDAGLSLDCLRVDGGACQNDFLMQFQADIVDVPVIRPVVSETTALGAAYAAGLAVGFWKDFDELKANWQQDKVWTPNLDDAIRQKEYAGWKKAVRRTFDWVDQGTA